MTAAAGVGQETRPHPPTEARAAEMRFAVSLFRNFAATTCRQEMLTLWEMLERVLREGAPKKELLEWWKLAIFGPNRTAKRSLRHDGNVVAISGLEADYDGEVISFEEAIAIAAQARIHCLIYTSPSHTPEKPRWRVMAPFSQNYDPTRRDDFMGRLNGAFRGVFSPESWTLSQAYYKGPVGEGRYHRALVVDGDYIDELDELDEHWMGKSGGGVGAKGNGQARGNGQAGAHQHGHIDEEAMLAELVHGHSFHLAKTRLAGLWARNGVPYIEARQRILDAFDNAPPDVRATQRWRDRRGDLDRTLEDIYGKQAKQDDAKEARREALYGGDEPEHDRPSILIKNGRIDRLVDAAEKVLLATNAPVFVRGRELVRPVLQQVPGSRGTLTVAASVALFSPAAMLDALSASADWTRWDGKARREVPADPPRRVAELLLTRVGRWRLRPLAGVISTPTLRPDGSLLDQPGYDAITRLYHLPDPTLTMPPIPARPTKEQAIAALKILYGVLDEFPFVTRVDRAVGFSGLITPVVSGAVPCAPLHAIDASAAGTGKSYYVDAASAIAAGRPAPALSVGGKPEELEARLVGALLAGYRIINLDNINGELASDLLCQAIERPTVGLRRLGGSDISDIEPRSVFFATGNGFRARGDLVRRTLPCRMDAGVERPERRHFEHRPVDEILANRGKYVAAALTIVRAYIVVGCPGKLPELNSFEMWSDYVRSALVWLGEADPAEAIEVAREDDPDLLALGDVMTNWLTALAEEPEPPGYLTARRLIALACRRCVTVMGEPVNEWRYPGFRDALLSVAGVRGEIHSARLGHWLRGHLGRIVGGRRIVRGPNDRISGTPTWGIE